jgi:hypothetical protein
MNSFSNIGNSGILKDVYPKKGIQDQGNNNSAMLAALRKKRDALKSR